MSTQRITISVPTEVAARLRRAARRTGSVSEWVTTAVTRTLEEEDLRQRFLEFCDAVNATPAEQKKADASFERVMRGKEAERAKSHGRRRKPAA